MTEQVPDQGAIPPVHPSALSSSMEEPRSRWPGVIGIIAIAWASLELLGGICGALAPLIMVPLMERLPQGSSSGMEWAKAYGGWQAAVQILNVLFAVVLLVGGIGLVRRRHRGMICCRIWAPLRMLSAVLALVLGIAIKDVQMEAIQRDPNIPSVLSGSFYDFMFIIGLVLGLAWQCALPVFLLVWFGRRKIRDEVHSWPQHDASNSPVPLARQTSEPIR